MPFFKFSGFRILDPQDLGILLVNHKKAGFSRTLRTDIFLYTEKLS